MKGTMITVRRNGKFVTRNASFFKQIQNISTDESAYDDDDTNPIVAPSSPRPRRYPSRNRVVVQRYGQNIYDT